MLMTSFLSNYIGLIKEIPGGSAIPGYYPREEEHIGHFSRENEYIEASYDRYLQNGVCFIDASSYVK